MEAEVDLFSKEIGLGRASFGIQVNIGECRCSQLVQSRLQSPSGDVHFKYRARKLNVITFQASALADAAALARSVRQSVSYKSGLSCAQHLCYFLYCNQTELITFHCEQQVLLIYSVRVESNLSQASQKQRSQSGASVCTQEANCTMQG